MTTDYHKEIEVASRLARQASDIVLSIYATDFAVTSKGKAGPVTEADLRANELIVEGLRKAFPLDGIISEEEPPTGRRSATRIWYVDPLDGTKEFVAKNGEFSIMIGLSVNGQARLGVVYRPVGDLLFGGITDQEAWREEAGRRTALKVSSVTIPQHLRMVVSRSHRHPVIVDMREGIGLTHELPCGSVGLKIGLLASDQGDVYVEPSSYTSAWDTCGPEAVLRGAGGRLTDLTGQPLVYGTDDVRNRRGLVATNGVCHDQVIAAIAPVVREAGLIQ